MALTTSISAPPPACSSISCTSTMTAAAYASNSLTSPTLHTPLSAKYPSSSLLPSPLVNIKRDDAIKTPLTPPAAYLDFLKNISSTITNPSSPSTATSATFSVLGLTTPSSAHSAGSEMRSSFLYPQLTTSARPALTSTLPTDSAESPPSTQSITSNGIAARRCASPPDIVQRGSVEALVALKIAPAKSMSASAAPDSAFPAPVSASYTARRPGQPHGRPSLLIPQSSASSSLSVVSPASVRSPRSICSPCAAPVPRRRMSSTVDHAEVGKGKGRRRQVSVRHLVTTTVTHSNGTIGAGTALVNGDPAHCGTSGKAVLRLPTTPLIGPAPRAKRKCMG